MERVTDREMFELKHILAYLAEILPLNMELQLVKNAQKWNTNLPVPIANRVKEIHEKEKNKRHYRI